MAYRLHPASTLAHHPPPAACGVIQPSCRGSQRPKGATCSPDRPPVLSDCCRVPELPRLSRFWEGPLASSRSLESCLSSCPLRGVACPHSSSSAACARPWRRSAASWAGAIWMQLPASTPPPSSPGADRAGRAQSLGLCTARCSMARHSYNQALHALHGGQVVQAEGFALPPAPHGCPSSVATTQARQRPHGEVCGCAATPRSA